MSAALEIKECPECSAEGFPVWHCRKCNHHSPLDRNRCQQCQHQRPPLTKVDLKRLEAALTEEHEAKEKIKPLLQPERDLYNKSMSVLARSVSGSSDVLHESAQGNMEYKLKRFGCEFMRAAYDLMRALDVPTEAKSFVVIIMAMSDGSNQQLIIPASRLAKISDVVN